MLAQLRAVEDEDDDLDDDLAERLDARASELEAELDEDAATETAQCMDCGDEHPVDAMAVYDDRDAAGVAARVRLCDRCGRQPRYSPAATDTDRRRIIPDGGQVEACRSCDSANLWRRTPTSAHSPYGPDDPRFRCVDCGAEFDRPVRREPRSPSRERSPHANALMKADPDDVMTDGGQDISAVFSRLCELAIADGDVPDDGSGLDGAYTRTVEARHRERDWRVGVNGDLDEEVAVEDWPCDGEETSLPPGQAVINLGAWPAGVLGPYGGRIAFEELEDGPQSLEDELLRDLETTLLDAGADIERTIPDVMTDGGEDVAAEDCSIPELRAELDALDDEIDWYHLSQYRDEHDRHRELFAELRSRVDVERPTCPKCSGDTWGQAPGDPVNCGTCGWHATDDVAEAVHDAWDEIRGHSEEVTA